MLKKLSYYCFVLVLFSVSIWVYWQTGRFVSRIETQNVDRRNFTDWAIQHYNASATSIVSSTVFPNGDVRVYVSATDSENYDVEVYNLISSDCQVSNQRCATISGRRFVLEGASEVEAGDIRTFTDIVGETGPDSTLSYSNVAPQLLEPKAPNKSPAESLTAAATEERERSDPVEERSIHFVTSPLVNVRDRPDRSGRVIDQVSPDDRLRVIEVDGNWSKVELVAGDIGRGGWIWSPLLSPKDE